MEIVEIWQNLEKSNTDNDFPPHRMWAKNTTFQIASNGINVTFLFSLKINLRRSTTEGQFLTTSNLVFYENCLTSSTQLEILQKPKTFHLFK